MVKVINQWSKLLRKLWSLHLWMSPTLDVFLEGRQTEIMGLRWSRALKSMAFNIQKVTLGPVQNALKPWPDGRIQESEKSEVEHAQETQWQTQLWRLSCLESDPAAINGATWCWVGCKWEQSQAHDSPLGQCLGCAGMTIGQEQPPKLWGAVEWLLPREHNLLRKGCTLKCGA